MPAPYTTSSERERLSDFPRTWLYDTLDRFFEEVMKPSDRDWE